MTRITAAAPTMPMGQLDLALLDMLALGYVVLLCLTGWNSVRREHGAKGGIRTPLLLFIGSQGVKWLVGGPTGWALACTVLLIGLLVSLWRGRRDKRLRGRLLREDYGRFDALMIMRGTVLRRSEWVGSGTLLGRTIEFASGPGTSWDVVIAGDNLDQLQKAAERSLTRGQSPLWRLWCAVRGVRGTGLQRLVGELGLAADLAAGFHNDAVTAFAFRDPTLGQALATKVVSTQREPAFEILAVLANPGYLRPPRHAG